MTVYLLQLTIFRVMKQTLRSSGANVTATHIEDVSLSALFFLEAAKETDNLVQHHRLAGIQYEIQ